MQVVLCDKAPGLDTAAAAAQAHALAKLQADDSK